jgi:short-subunit dehydrogenase
MASLARKVVIITGASSGIGRATALALSRDSVDLVLVARRQELLRQLQQTVSSMGGVAVPLTLDLREPAHVETMVGRTLDQFGRIDVLINNAAVGFYGTVENTPPEVVREIFALNFSAPLLACQLAIPVMRAQGGGHIINVSSIAGKRGLPLSGIYCATKFALHGITESLRVELKDIGIHVSLVNPAATRTEFGDNVRLGDVTKKFAPIGHVQSAEEVAAAIVSCIKRPRAEVYPNALSRFVVWANAFAPRAVDALMMRFLRQRLAARAPVSK